MDLLVDKVLTPGIRLLGNFFWQIIDLKIIDNSVNAIGVLFNASANILRKLQTGLLYHYVFVVIASTVLLLAWLVGNQIMGSV